MTESKIKCIHLIYFSPSGSTEKIVRKIASGIQGPEITEFMKGFIEAFKDHRLEPDLFL